MNQLKAITAGVVAGLAFAIPVVDDGVSLADALGIALAAVVGWQSTYWVKNTPTQE